MWIYVQLFLMLYLSHGNWLAIFQNSLSAGARIWYWTVNADEILNQFGDINTLALDNIIDPSDESDEEMTLMIPSQYYTVDNLPVEISHSGKFNVISLNAQSINAKFDSRLILLEIARQQNITIHVICIQESWLDENCDLSLYQIEGLIRISQGKRRSSRGGLMTHVNSQYNTSVIDVKNDSPIWESLFFTVKDMDIGKEIVVGNIYRPPYDNDNEQNVTTFVTELEPIIAILNDGNHGLLIAGEFNINLLHSNNSNKDRFGKFLDMLLGHSLFPKITFLTRLGENIHLLIDNIFCSLSHNSVASLAGIICTGISDHFLCFLSLRLRTNDNIEQPNKLIKLRVNSNEAYEAFFADLQTCDFATLLDHTSHGDPKQNYDKLHQKLSELKCKHLPWRFVRWITHGVIKSIKYRDKLYRNLTNGSKDLLSYAELKNRLSVYNKILKKTIREAKYIYYNRQFEESRTNVRKTWSTINEIICRTIN